MHTATWKERLAQRLPPELSAEIDAYQSQLELRRLGTLDEKVFAELRLRRGVYGQRYDNGQRYDGFVTRELSYPSGDVVKGPNTLWDAPGMQRIKIPFGALTAEQVELLADLAEEYSDAICHVTTRQDIQLHFVHIDDTPELMRRLAAVGITTREACGNSVRNVTGCPLAGVCPDEAFDISPYARALAHFLLGHPDAQDFGRKFKISFSGCSEHACGLAHMHDIGLVAQVRRGADGGEERGFTLLVGGGLGAVPHAARLFDDFLPMRELMPTAQAICRVFARLGEKKNRARARLKFLVARLGLDEFRRLVLAERAALEEDPRWTAWLDEVEGAEAAEEGTAAGRQGAPPAAEAGPPGAGFAAWRATNVRPQRQPGLAVATVALPLGDASAQQMRALAAVARRFAGGRLRATVEQNFVLRWVPEAELPRLHAALAAADLAAPVAGTVVDVTACPGTDTCKLGIASSRGLAAELSRRVASRGYLADEAVRNLRIKVSGCFNSCGQHHVADIGFYGVSRRKGSHQVPHFQVVLGGQWRDNAGAFGLAILPIPARRIPETVDRILELYLCERRDGEAFKETMHRLGRGRIRSELEGLATIPDYQEDPDTYTDWGDPREFTIQDMGVGECAGEVVSAAEFGLAESEREVFEAQLELDRADAPAAARRAYAAMIKAARAVTRIERPELGEEPDEIVREFKAALYDTRLFFDPFAGPKFANFLLQTHATPRIDHPSPEGARQRIEEAQLFIEAAHSCYGRLSTARPAAAGG